MSNITGSGFTKQQDNSTTLANKEVDTAVPLTAAVTNEEITDTANYHILYSSAPENTPTEHTDTTENSNIRPTITLTTPNISGTVNTGSNLIIIANATDSDGSISKVAFYANGKWLGKGTSKPYTFNWENIPEGNHTIYAVATDDKLATTKSATKTITAGNTKSLQAPNISITSPSDASSITLGSAINIQASATDLDGSVTQVAFYADESLLGTDYTSPYSLQWNTSTLGSHKIYAVATDDDGLTTTSQPASVSVTASESNELVTYKATSDIQSLFKSEKFAVTVSQNASTHDSFVYQSNNMATPSWKGTLEYMQKANHWSTFSFAGKVTIEARKLDSTPVETCIVRPLTLGIQPEIKGDKCTFELTQPAKLSVEIDDAVTITRPITGIGKVTKEIVKNPLFIFAQPLETDIPDASDSDVIYLGPGIHEIGKNYSIPNNKELYIAGGAYVIGTLTAGHNPTNIKIRGRGILSGHGLSETKAEHNSWGNHSIAFTSGRKGSGLVIEGITITDPLRSCIVSYNTVTIRNVSMFSWNHRNDGITAGNKSVIENGFIKVQDDNLKLYYSNQSIRNMVIWQQTAGSVFKLSWNLKSIAQNITVENIDIIHSDVFTDYTSAEPDQPELHSTSAIFSAMGFQEGAAFQNSLFKNIRIEEKHPLRLMSLRMVSTHQGPVSKSVWGDPNPSAKKTIANIDIKNISVKGVPYKQSTLYGNAGGTINAIQFNNMTVNNNPILSKWDLTSRIDGTGLRTQGSVSNISFNH
ncbi:Ig-like domain-containing protein [Halioxenophilus aromaticivorans]|uniref:Uncharacterized protein n=1 Tax=Halioxenophilus aromaticivorans TaxID=1306992 RepID=A0AAV3U1D7_9ALTE